MKIEELFDLICPDEYKDISKRVLEINSIEELNGKYPMSFIVLDESETEKYELCEQNIFIGITEYIQMYNLDILDYYIIMKQKDYSGTLDLIMKRMKKYENKLSKEYLIGCHMCLHELGHFQQYVDRKRNVVEYTQWCLNETKNNFYQQQILNNSILQRINNEFQKRSTNKTLSSKSNIRIEPTKAEKIGLHKLAKEYRDIPKEKNADQFAYDRMEIAIGKICDFLKDIN